MDDALDLAALMIALCFLLIGIAIAALIWFIIAALIAHYRYNRFKLLAEKDFEQDAAELGLDIPAEAVGEAFWESGVEVPAGKRNMGQVVGATFFGTEEVEEMG